MSGPDVLAITAYFLVVLGAGFWYRKRAAQSLESYFLGGRRIHWSMLAMSGAVSTFDITGTMWMVSVMYVLGMQSWWQHWMWGVAMPAFALAYLARWVRRSNVMTAAEWMKTRFGDEPGGRLARYAAALMAIIFTTAMIGYAFQGIGKFAAVYIPLELRAAKRPGQRQRTSVVGTVSEDLLKSALINVAAYLAEMARGRFTPRGNRTARINRRSLHSLRDRYPPGRTGCPCI